MVLWSHPVNRPSALIKLSLKPRFSDGPPIHSASFCCFIVGREVAHRSLQITHIQKNTPHQGLIVKRNRELVLYLDKDLGFTSVCICQNLVSVHLKFVRFIVYDFHTKANSNCKRIKIFMLKYLGENFTEVRNSFCNASTNKVGWWMHKGMKRW